jgi:peptidoglycan/xylan/chitin deacetylase (PgdA/CDA1 family)
MAIKGARPLRALAWNFSSVIARCIPHTPRMTVLLYHSIENGGDFFSVSPEEFRWQLETIKKNAEVVPLSRAFLHAKGESVARDSVAVTFDDGYRDFLTSALPILKELEVPATVFVLGENPDRTQLENDVPLMSPEDIRAVSSESVVSIGSHALTHRKLTRLTASERKDELEGSRAMIMKQSGILPEYIAYPKGNYNDAVLEDVRLAGFSGGCSVIERGVRAGDNVYTLPRIQVDSSTTRSLLVSKLTRAADVYYAFWSIVRRQKAK